MTTVSAMLGRPRTCVSMVLALAFISLVALAAGAPAGAQENQTSAPAPLPWPALEADTSSTGLDISLLRTAIESQANVELCKILMKQANQPVPDTLTWNQCPSQFQQDVTSGNGQVAWASGARPTQCGTSCMGRPFMTQSVYLDRPNAIYAMLYGHLDFAIDVPGPFNRNVRYGYEAHFRCVTNGDSRVGLFTVDVVFEPPVVDDPGALESIASFLIPVYDLSRAIEEGIREQLSTPGTTTATFRPCTSVGVMQAALPADDRVLFHIPPAGTRPRPGGALGDAVVGQRATVHFLRITRKPPTPLYTPPADAGMFRVYLNGVQGDFPDSIAARLPVGGGSAAINYCKTIDVRDVDRLQLIFANSNGGAVWSQFAQRAGYGAGRPHTMTTARTVVVPGTSGPPDPVTGKPTTTKPQSIVVQEFELLYTIDYQAPATVATTTSSTGGGGRRPGIPHPVVGGATLGGAAPKPCQKM
jgi:hypothetical protein